MQVRASIWVDEASSAISSRQSTQCLRHSISKSTINIGADGVLDHIFFYCSPRSAASRPIAHEKRYWPCRDSRYFAGPTILCMRSSLFVSSTGAICHISMQFNYTWNFAAIGIACRQYTSISRLGTSLQKATEQMEVGQEVFGHDGRDGGRRRWGRSAHGF